MSGQLHNQSASAPLPVPPTVNNLYFQQADEAQAITALSFAESLPDAYRSPLIRLARQDARYFADWPGWDDLKAAVRITEAFYRDPSTRLPLAMPDGLSRAEEHDYEVALIVQELDDIELRRVGYLCPFAAALAARASILRQIVATVVDEAAHDLLGAPYSDVRARAEALAQAEHDALPLAMPTLRVGTEAGSLTTTQANDVGLQWDFEPDIKRRLDPEWWTRQLRSQLGEACLLIAGHLGLVGHDRSRYCDEHVLGRWQEQQVIAAHMAESTVFTCGEEWVWLDDILAGKEEAELARVYAQTLAMQHLGEVEGLVPVFITVTLPSEWHQRPRFHRPGHAWNGKSQRQARKQLVKDWADYMRKLRGKVVVFGMRVVEPHQDGTPHMHVMAWVHPDNLGKVFKTLRRHFGSAPRAKAVRITNKRKNAARPASYLLKYIRKTLTAGCEEAADGKATREAHRAWASAVRARRWELIGCANGIKSTWDEVYAMKKLPSDASAVFRAAWTAMRAAEVARQNEEDTAPHWADAMRALIGEEALDGGGRAARAVRNVYEIRINKYGEAVKKVVGVTDGTTTITNDKQWTKQHADTAMIEKHRVQKMTSTEHVGVVLSYPRVVPNNALENAATTLPLDKIDPQAVADLTERRVRQWRRDAEVGNVYPQPTAEAAEVALRQGDKQAIAELYAERIHQWRQASIAGRRLPQPTMADTEASVVAGNANMKANINPSLRARRPAAPMALRLAVHSAAPTHPQAGGSLRLAPLPPNLRA